jgi:hypothetical protein
MWAIAGVGLPDVTGTWRHRADGTVVTGADAAELLQRRADDDQLETWFVREDGALIGVVTNRERALVVWLDEPGDPGRHAIDPGAGGGRGDGYRLANGQVDHYADRDTVPFALARQIVRSLVDRGTAPDGVDWQADG